MSHPHEGDGDIVTSVETQFSASLLSRSSDSIASRYSVAVAETLRPTLSVLSDGTTAHLHSSVMEEANMGSASAPPLLSSMGAPLDLSSTEMRLRLAQEAELSVLVRLRLLTEALTSVVSASNASGVASKATTTAHGDGDAEDVVALPTEGAIRALLPAVIVCPSTTGAEEATHMQPEARIVVRRVAMPPAGLSAAAKEQYTALREILALHFWKSGKGGVDSASDVAGGNACVPSTMTTQGLKPIGHCGAASSAVDSQTTEAVDSSSIGTPTTPHALADEESGAPTSPAALCLSAVEAQRRTRFFSDLRYCPPSPPQRSVSPCKQHATDACGDPQTSTAAAGVSSGSASWGTRAPHFLWASSQVYSLKDGLFGEKNGASPAGMGPALPKLAQLSAEVSSAEWEAVGKLDVIRGEAAGGHHREERGGAAPSAPEPTVSAIFATAPTSGPSPCVVKVEPGGSSRPRVPPLARHRTTTANTWEGSDRADLGRQPSQDTPPQSMPLKSSPHRLSQPLSATPTSSVGDADEEGMYFPTPPPAKTHRHIEGKAELSARPPAAGNSANACRRAGGDSAFRTTLSPTPSATSLRPRLAFGGDRDRAGGEPTGASQWERRMEVAASPSPQMLDVRHEGVSKRVSIERCAPVSRLSLTVPAPPPMPTRVFTATDILATITALPPPSSSSLLSKPAHRGGKETRATRKVRAALAEAQPKRGGARKRTRGEGDEWARIGVGDYGLAPAPLEGLPSLGVDVSWSAAAALGRGVWEEIDDTRHWGPAATLRLERESRQNVAPDKGRAPSGCVRTCEQRAVDVAQAERVLSAVRAACRLPVPASLQASSRCCGADLESDEALSSPSPSLSQNTPRQFWDINFP